MLAELVQPVHIQVGKHLACQVPNGKPHVRQHFVKSHVPNVSAQWQAEMGIFAVHNTFQDFQQVFVRYLLPQYFH